MKLYEGLSSSASWRVRWALALKGVKHESVYADVPSGHHFSRVPVSVNPLHAVPSLELDDGTVLTESVAIIEYLDETIPTPPLLPKDPLARAKVRALVELVNAAIHPLQNTSMRLAISDDPVKQKAWAAKWIERGLRAYETHVARTAGTFSFGETLTMADLFLVPQVKNVARFGATIDDCPTVQRIYAHCIALPEAVATNPDRITELHRDR